MKKAKHNFIATLIYLYANFIFGTSVFGQAGSLDLSFGTGGIVTTDISGAEDRGYSVAIQTDGEIVLGGYSWNATNYNFALTRYNTNGTLDSEFGVGGIDTTDLGHYDYGYSLAIQSDNKIVVAGNSNYDFALVRYNYDGSLDNTFGSDGKVITDLLYQEEGNSVAIQTDSKIIVSGYSYTGTYMYFALVRYNIDGTLDNTFDADKVIIDDCPFIGVRTSIALQEDGKIVLAATTYNYDTNEDFIVIRYNTDGSLDYTFGLGGFVITDLATYKTDIGLSVDLQSDEKIVVGGATFDENWYFALARYNSDGSLDNTFDFDGKVITDSDLFDDYGYGYSVIIQPDDKIILAGNSFHGIRLNRYNVDGSLDNTFATNGKVTTEDYDNCNSIALQSDGKIVAAGWGGPYDFEVARFNNDIAEVGILTSQPNPPSSNINISSNPFSNELLITGTSESGELFLFDIPGREILRQKISSNQTTINTEKLLPGIYLLSYSDGKNTQNFKVVKN